MIAFLFFIKEDFSAIFSYSCIERTKCMPDVIILGGGLSGLSAAVELADAGLQPLVLEQSGHCGGRTYSFVDAATNDSIDNGQHLLMGCYVATRRYLRMIDAEPLFELQPSLQIFFFHPEEGTKFFSCPQLPAPVHLFWGLMLFSAIPFRERIQMLNVAFDLVLSSPSKEKHLDTLTADAWLQQHHQSDLSRKYLWDVITIGALNNVPQRVSALMLYRVLRASFLGKRENTSLLFPRTDLSTALIKPAINFIRRHGGDVRTNVEVTKLHGTSTQIDFIQASDGMSYRANHVISALPWFRLKQLLENSNLDASSVLKTQQPFDWNRFQPSPIIAIHLWLDREVMTEPFAASIDTRVQWIFNRTALVGKKEVSHNLFGSKQQLSFVISGAQEFTEQNKEELVRIALEDMRRVLPYSRTANVVHSLVIKEKRATFSPSPELESYRPQTQTTFSNFFLAGDWTATGYPATIEGAVLSGRRAAAQLQSL
jgi:squalene-associated FAD-dependent desaturase